MESIGVGWVFLCHAVWVAVVLAAVFLSVNIASSPDRELSATSVLDVIQDRGIPCDDAEVSRRFGTVCYECAVASESLLIMIEGSPSVHTFTDRFAFSRRVICIKVSHHLPTWVSVDS